MTETNNEQINVIVAMNFSDEIIAQLRDISPKLNIQRYWPDVPESAWADAEVLYTMRHFPDPEQAPLLRWVQLHYAGMERAQNQPIVQAEDVDVTSASGIHASHMAEYCLMMMLAFAYNIPAMMRMKTAGQWPEHPFQIFEPHGLREQTIGIVGYGSIGRELARVAKALGMRVLAAKRDVRRSTEDNGYMEEGLGDPAGEIPERIYPGAALESMASECDYLVLTVPLTEETHHMVNEAVLEAMKPSAVLVNVARGSVVDEEALISALASDQLAGAALDVFEEEPLPPSSPLWNMDNVIMSPHVAGYNSKYHRKAASLFAENLRRYLDKRPLLNALNREQGY